jgi:peptide-methionine (R)-S-oxide reductase
MNRKVKRSEKEWRTLLSPEEYLVLRQKGTEPRFTEKRGKRAEEGIYTCKGCGTALFSSNSKFNSGSGWPSFSTPTSSNNITLKRDTSLGMIRTEVTCSVCDSHLGHVFDDGPKPSGKRFCVNSIALKLKKKETTHRK